MCGVGGSRMQFRERNKKSFPTGDKTATGTDYSKPSPIVTVRNPSLFALIFSRKRKI